MAAPIPRTNSPLPLRLLKHFHYSSKINENCWYSKENYHFRKLYKINELFAALNFCYVLSGKDIMIVIALINID